MRKVMVYLLSLVLTITLFTGCGTKKETPKDDNKEPVATNETDSNTEQPTDNTNEGAEVKTGLAVISSIGKSTDAGKDPGLAQVDSTIVALTVDNVGVIRDCVIDGAQTKINFGGDGKLTTDLTTEFKTKQELEDQYGMAKASSIGKEWFDQANALANYVVGKTLEEVKGIAISGEGKPTDADLASSVTISIGGYITAIEKAVNNATNLGAKEEDQLGLGALTNIAKSTNPDKEDGIAQAYTNYAATTFGKDGVITSCIIDASQTDVTFSKEGKITSDLKADFKTKNEIGANYGMAKASSIGKEWNEQAAAFANYVTGKKLEEVRGIAVNDEGVPTESDLTGSVTIHIGDFITVLGKASESAAK